LKNLNQMKKIVQGIITPLVTPLIDNSRLDIAGLERLIEHVISGGVHGIFILGTTGEAQNLAVDLRIELIRQSHRIINKRVPLLVGISDTSITESIRLAEAAGRFGADALVSTPPFYFMMDQTELAEYYESLVPRLSLPLYLYNMPANTKINFDPQTIRRLAENPRVVGFKDSSGSAPYLQQVMHEMRNHDNFSIFVGPEEMTAEMVLLGADGGVNGGANIFPRLYVDLYHAAAKNEIAAVRTLQAKVMAISSSLYTVGENSSSYLKGLKCSLELMGICNGFVASPFTPFNEQQRERIKAALEKLRISCE
jgi:4-hydroxy-tetrahydrodipicolinate synthase